MNKLIILGLFAVTSACVGQSGVNPSTPDLVEEAVANADFVRLVLAQSLAKANLPVAFQERGNQVLVDADARLDACEQQVRETGLLWVFKVCTTTVLKTSRWQLKQLQKEAALAAATSTAAPEVVA